jgi:predicted AAA+ superfamily ATPase
VVLAEAKTPTLIDEWQLVPSVLAAVKRAVDEDQTPGRFLLTGSVRADSTTSSWPATGRLVRLTQWGLSQRELKGKAGARSFFDVAFSGGLAKLSVGATPYNLRDYVNLALVGGFPDAALHDSEKRRATWLKSYVEQLLTHDAPMLGEHRDPLRLAARAADVDRAGGAMVFEPAQPLEPGQQGLSPGRRLRRGRPIPHRAAGFSA